MPIPVACQCGKQVNAPDNLAGKRVKCPGCGNALDIPAAAPAAPLDSGLGGLLSEEGMSDAIRCPQCSEDLKPGAVLCVACGFHLEKGKQVKGVVAKSGGHSGVANELLARAEEALEETPVVHEGAYGKKTQEWLLFAIMGVLVAAVVAGALAFFQSMEKKYDNAKPKPEFGQFRQTPLEELHASSIHQKSDNETVVAHSAGWPRATPDARDRLHRI